MRKKNTTKVPGVHYFQLILIIILTILISLILRNWYVSRINYENNIPILTDILQVQIHADEIYDYIRENENVVIYMGVADDDECRSFEKDFHEIIVRENLQEVITYLNLSNINNRKDFLKEFNKFYGSDVKGYPSFVVFADGKVSAVLSVEIGDELKIEKVQQFLKQNKIASDYDD